MHVLNRLLIAVAMAGAAGAAVAHGDEDHKPKKGSVHKEQTAWGTAGEARQARRTIDLTMDDTMRFKPDTLNVTEGDTVRLVMVNRGKQLHELVIGTTSTLDEHAALMMKFPNMEHDEPYMAHVRPGETGEIVWTFNRAGEFDFACLVAGHYQAGMKGKIIVAAKARKGTDHEQHKH